MRKNFNKLATLALSGMMVMSMAMPAMAAEVDTGLPWKKVLYTDKLTPAPDTTFKFEVKKVAAGTHTFDGQSYTTLEAKSNDAVHFGDITFDPTVDGLGTVITGKDGRMFEKTGKIFVDADKLGDDYGDYLFEMNEVDGKYEGIAYAPTKFQVLVQKRVDGVKVFVQREGKREKASAIYNNYGMHTPPENPDTPPVTPPGPTDPNPYDTTHDVLIKKKVTGQYGDTNKDFTFNITVTPDDKPGKNGKGEHYTISVDDPAGNNNPRTYTLFKGGATQVVTVKHERQGIHIGGLSENDKITVVESNGTGYTMTVAENDVSYIKDLDKKPASLAAYTTSFNSIKDGGEVTVTNTKDAVTPTGIVMNVAPYAMMLAVAGGLGVVFVNRKKEEE